MAEALDEHGLVGAEERIATRLLVRLAQERRAKRLRRLHRPQRAAVDGGLDDVITDALDRLRDRQRADGAPARPRRRHDPVDERPRDERPHGVVHDDHRGALGHGVQAEPHRLLSLRSAGDDVHPRPTAQAAERATRPRQVRGRRRHDDVADRGMTREVPDGQREDRAGPEPQQLLGRPAAEAAADAARGNDHRDVTHAPTPRHGAA